MNKQELSNEVAAQLGMSKASAGCVVDAVLFQITNALAQDKTLTLQGFGTFSVRHRPARMGRNPKTGHPLEIKSAAVPVFKPGKMFKESVV